MVASPARLTARATSVGPELFIGRLVAVKLVVKLVKLVKLVVKRRLA